MLNYNDLKPGIVFTLNGEPYTVLKYSHVKKQRGKPVVNLTIKNLVNGKVKEHTARQSDSYDEAEIQEKPSVFSHCKPQSGECWFYESGNKSARFPLAKEVLGNSINYLKPGLEVNILIFKNKPVSVRLPIKVDLKVTEAPPNIRGSTAEGGTKTVITETGYKLNTPLFIKQGDVVRINTETGDYVERVSS